MGGGVLFLLLLNQELLFCLWHQLQLLLGLELEVHNSGRQEETKDDLKAGVSTHSEAAHPKVAEDDLGDGMGEELTVFCHDGQGEACLEKY